MTDFSRYLIASDIDGTYLAPGMQIVERNLTALERFRAGGGLFTLSTGRIAVTIDPGVPFVRQTLNAPAVLSNGAVLYDFHTDRIYSEALMDEDIVNELLTLLLDFKAPGEPIQMSARDGMYFDELNESLSRYVAPCRPGTIFISDPTTWRHDIAYKLLAHGSPEKLKVLRAEIERRFGNRVGITTSGENMLELQRPDCNKAVGLQKLRAHIGEGRILIACGDYDNDLEMLQAADIAVCPENACDAVKAICDYQLCHCKDGLIADIIEKIEAGELHIPQHKRRTV